MDGGKLTATWSGVSTDELRILVLPIDRVMLLEREERSCSGNDIGFDML